MNKKTYPNQQEWHAVVWLAVPTIADRVCPEWPNRTVYYMSVCAVRPKIAKPLLFYVLALLKT